MRDAARREFDMVMAWSVDRVDRSLQELVSFSPNCTRLFPAPTGHRHEPLASRGRYHWRVECTALASHALRGCAIDVGARQVGSNSPSMAERQAEVPASGHSAACWASWLTAALASSVKASSVFFSSSNVSSRRLTACCRPSCSAHAFSVPYREIS
jgi:hypothetical protein